MKIKYNSDDELRLNKAVEIHNATIIATAVFHKNNKYYQEFFLDEYLYEL